MDKFSPVPHDRAFVERALKKRGVKAAYDALEEEYTLAAELVRARKKAGLTQEEVARRMGTKRPAVARIESATSGHSPSVETLRKYAGAVGRKLKIRLAA
ncbi:MAG: helix-turn-helix transcriptional regulator [Betaproteobacteria bacterium]|nr:helix-turn-helix transcriptional regulator [Betaproteobacteria bacterium]